MWGLMGNSYRIRRAKKSDRKDSSTGGSLSTVTAGAGGRSDKSRSSQTDGGLFSRTQTSLNLE